VQGGVDGEHAARDLDEARYGDAAAGVGHRV
jgi:hypothetical protein